MKITKLVELVLCVKMSWWYQTTTKKCSVDKCWISKIILKRGERSGMKEAVASPMCLIWWLTCKMSLLFKVLDPAPPVWLLRQVSLTTSFLLCFYLVFVASANEQVTLSCLLYMPIFWVVKYQAQHLAACGHIFLRLNLLVYVSTSRGPSL